MPQLIGKSLQEGLTELATAQLNVRLLPTKEDLDSKEGTIISHVPAAGQKVKTHQTVYVVTTSHPAQQSTPSLYGLSLETINQLLHNKKIRYKSFFVASIQQEGLCVGQIPAPKEPLLESGMIIYCSSKNTDHVIFPHLEGISAEEVVLFLKKYRISPRIFHIHAHNENKGCAHCFIKEQRPLPGTLINLHKPFSVQLKV